MMMMIDDSSEDDDDSFLPLVDDKGKESDIDDDSPGIAAKSKKRKKKNSEKYVFCWRNREPPVTNSDFKGAAISLPPQDFDQLTPFWYFTQFWDIDMTNHLVEQTNLYSVQKTGKSTNTNRKELEQLIGIMMKMEIVKMPLYQNYWSQSTPFTPIADVMSLNRFKNLRRFLHANDNSKKMKKGIKTTNCSKWHLFLKH